MPELLEPLSDFRLLRPLWLVGLLALPLVWYILRRIRYDESSWSRAIQPELLPYLLEEQVQSRAKNGANWLIIVAITLALIALAGPAWKKVPQPVHRVENAVVLILDLSLSMLVEDIQPSRLVKARHKLLDILDQHKGGQAALIAYAGDAHVVAPLTDDTATIKNLVPALSPLIMPEMGSDPVDAINLALQLLRDAGVVRGKILLLSDGVEFSQIEPVVEQLADSGHELAVMAVGTAEGGPIPLPEKGFLKQQGEIVIARTGIPALETLAKLSRGRFSHLQIDDADIEYLLDSPALNLDTQTRQVERDFDQWREEGPWLLLLLAPLAALGFRRGVIFALAFMVLTPTEQALAASWQDLWLTRDQQARQKLEAGEHQQAAELFESPKWKAAAHYRAEDFASAEQFFQQDESATGHYNHGNALAKLGKLDEAIAAYSKALEMDPDHEDAAYNKELVEQLRQQQQQNKEAESGDQDQQQQHDDGESGEQDQQQQAQNGEQQADQSRQDASPSAQGDPAQSQDQAGDNSTDQPDSQQAEQNPGDEQQASADQQQQPGQETADAGEQQTQAQNREQQDGDPSEQNTAQAMSTGELSDEELQAMEQWLRRIPDDPGGLLRRKFDYEYRKRQLEQQFMPRSGGEPIW